jgi:hypothetical protein
VRLFSSCLGLYRRDIGQGQQKRRIVTTRGGAGRRSPDATLRMSGVGPFATDAAVELAGYVRFGPKATYMRRHRE